MKGRDFMSEDYMFEDEELLTDHKKNKAYDYDYSDDEEEVSEEELRHRKYLEEMQEKERVRKQQASK